ncbi:DUF2807 domain-containing protein [Sphingomonas piscis]|uniref:DUF2807 domain-containing protein n=1 Tax=Sphingomonas piscis TaxID=2714943 RepID=A0A6G7YP98_9SPHN|nr:head GIN domain-containing protein [Sphingomonas piscis]QIK78561.1 DUF2807 domain-containing protein [Sphingomonas piscis]
MRQTSTFGAIVGALMTAACNHAGAQDAGPETSRSFTVGDFDRIEVSGPYDVDVRTGGAVSVSAKGPENIIERMDVVVEGGRLFIRPRKDGQFNINWGSSGHVTVQVTVPSLRGAEVAGSGDIKVDKVQGDRFEASIRGSGDIAVDHAEVQSFAAVVTGSGDVRAAAGRTNAAELTINGSGKIDAAGLQAQSASTTIKGSGNIAAYASGTAEVRIFGSGDVEIKGGAKCQVTNKGSGNFRCS